MEPAAAWGRPYEFQVASWSSAEEPGAQAAAWDPAGLPIVVDYASTDDVFGNGSLQPYLHSSSSSLVLLQQQQQQQQQQLALYNYDYSAPTQHAAAVAQEPSDDYAMGVFEAVTDSFEGESDSLKLKMHRFPATITRALGESYTVPRVVAIGPYYHGRRQELVMAEKVKHVAAYHCIRNSGCTVRQIFDAVVSVADGARGLYDKDVMATISRDDFRHMMFFDACFLVQFMLRFADGCDPSLYDFLEFNESDILHDVMLLENQIPWRVVETVMHFIPVSLGMLICNWRGRLQDRIDVKDEPVDLDQNYHPPHFLGFIRFYLVGRNDAAGVEDPQDDKIKALSTSVSAIELAEMAINLKANNQATELAHMGLVYMKDLLTLFFPKLSMAPLCLDNTRASWLVNMVALELSTTRDFFDDKADIRDSAACSYLLLLCMLVHREEDVHQLRTKGILKGGAGLTNKEALRFFTSLRSCLRPGKDYAYVMLQIARYRLRMWIWIMLYAFGCRNWKTIVGIGSAIGAFAGIIKTIKSLKGTQHY
jgi:hypothetical protein